MSRRFWKTGKSEPEGGRLVRQTPGSETKYSHPGLLALLHRRKLDYRKPEVVPRKLDAAKQKAFIKSYNDLIAENALMRARIMSVLIGRGVCINASL